MAIPITVPRLGWSMDEGSFAGWQKQAGDDIRLGDSLFLLESDKATEEIPAIDTGVLWIPGDAPKAGEVVKVGRVLGYLLAEGEQPPVQVTPAQPAKPIHSVRSVASIQTASGATRTGDEPAISPRARRVARELRLDWRGITGTGRSGRIDECDVRAAAGQDRGRFVPHTPMRKTIAARMVAGVTQAAPVTLHARVDVTELVGQRDALKAAGISEVPGYTEIFVKLTAEALKSHPLLQAQWTDEGLLIPDRIDIAIAIDTEVGLLAPVIRQADKLPLSEITRQARDLIAKARAGKLTAAEMRGATFTITNLGGLGVDAFTPIILLPQCASLGLGRIVREPAVVGDQIVARDMMTLSLTFDHRVLDGAPAARFLDTVRRHAEAPAILRST